MLFPRASPPTSHQPRAALPRNSQRLASRSGAVAAARVIRFLTDQWSVPGFRVPHEGKFPWSSEGGFARTVKEAGHGSGFEIPGADGL